MSWTPVISPAGLIVYSGKRWPQWRGDLFIGGLSSQALVRVDVDGTHARKGDQRPMGERIREPEEGPDGAIWLLEDGRREGRGRLVKLTPRGAGQRLNAPIDIAKERRYSYAMSNGAAGGRMEILQGTLDLMVLKTLDAIGPLHGYGIARRIEQISDDVLKLNEGTVYTSLMRLQQQGWISATWGTSENNRRARFYALTRSGRAQLRAETRKWERIAGVMARLLRSAGEA